MTKTLEDVLIKLAVVETNQKAQEKRLARMELIVWGVAVACCGVVFKAWNTGAGL